MNRAKHERESKKFMGKTDCYIHAEMKDGKMELLVSGQLLGIIHAMSNITERVSILSGQSFDDVLQTVKMWEIEKLGINSESDTED